MHESIFNFKDFVYCYPKGVSKDLVQSKIIYYISSHNVIILRLIPTFPDSNDNYQLSFSQFNKQLNDRVAHVIRSLDLSI